MKNFLITKNNWMKTTDAYEDDEWLEATQIGHEFNGKPFTAREYFKYEEKYLNLILLFFDAANLSYLKMMSLPKVTAVTDRYINRQKRVYPVLFEPRFDEILIANNRRIYRDELAVLVKMNLRQFFNCKLALSNRFSLSFGRGSTVHIETIHAPKKFKKPIGINVEEIGYS